MEQRFFNVVILFLTLMMLVTGLFLSSCDGHASGSPMASGSSISSHGGGSF